MDQAIPILSCLRGYTIHINERDKVAPTTLPYTSALLCMLSIINSGTMFMHIPQGILQLFCSD